MVLFLFCLFISLGSLISFLILEKIKTKSKTDILLIGVEVSIISNILLSVNGLTFSSNVSFYLKLLGFFILIIGITIFFYGLNKY